MASNVKSMLITLLRLLLLLLQVCLEEMPQHVKTFQSFQNVDEYGNLMVPTDKMDEIKRR